MTAIPLLPAPPAGRHPFLTGNFAPVKRELSMTACRISHGSLPDCLRGGQYVRNGGNALKDDVEHRDAHWFDGDGMLTGVLFHQDGGQPHFINRYILTDVLLSSARTHRRPLLPSITTFAAPVTPFALFSLLAQIMRTFVLALLTWLPFPGRSGIPLKRISTANTSIWWHDGQAFAGCESGPPMRIMLPGLETAEWWTGSSSREDDDDDQSSVGWGTGMGPIKMLREFTTAHPRIDPQTNELLLYHMSFAAPYLRISVIPARQGSHSKLSALRPLHGAVVPGMEKPKLMHDFCATSKRTILIDMPLSLDPRNLLHGKPMLSYDATAKTRFGVLPRREPGKVKWYESEASCIYHAANAWDDDSGDGGVTTSLLACRLNSATLVYAAGNVEPPADAHPRGGDMEKCQLYYWQFADVPDEKRANSTATSAKIACEFALSDIPVEFPTMNDDFAQRKNRFVYGTSMRSGTFDAGLGSRSAKIDCLVKFDVQRLVTRGLRARQYGLLRDGQAVDQRTVHDILDGHHDDKDDLIRVFALPPHHYAQEATFVPRSQSTSAAKEDDGYLVFFVFDERSGLDEHGDCRNDARSQLWVLDARTMRDVVCKVDLPQRVPYGLHGHFFSQREIDSQRRVDAGALRTWAMARGYDQTKVIPPKAVARMGRTLTGALQYAATGCADAFRSSVEHALAW